MQNYLFFKRDDCFFRVFVDILSFCIHTCGHSYLYSRGNTSSFCTRDDDDDDDDDDTKTRLLPAFLPRLECRSPRRAFGGETVLT